MRNATLKIAQSALAPRIVELAHTKFAQYPGEEEPTGGGMPGWAKGVLGVGAAGALGYGGYRAFKSPAVRRAIAAFRNKPAPGPATTLSAESVGKRMHEALSRIPTEEGRQELLRGGISRLIDTCRCKP